MSAKIKELREKRAKAIADARAINDKAAAEKRSMNAQETEQFDGFMNDADKHREEIESLEGEVRRLDRLAKHEQELQESRGRQTDPTPPGRGAGGPETRGRDGKTPIEYRYKTRSGQERTFELSGVRASDDYLRDYRSYLRGDIIGAEFRTQYADSDTDGGFLVAPQQMSAQLIQRVDDAVFVRQHANVLPPVTGAQSLGAPSLDQDPDDAEWVSELTSGSKTGIKFGRRELHPHPSSKEVQISERLIRLASMQPEQLLLDRLQYKFGVTEENAFLTGSGANQPMGIYTPHADGITTARDVATKNTPTAVTFDGLIEAKYFMKAGYWARARWNFHRDAIKQLVLVKDGEGRYVWRESVSSGEPSRLLDLPVDISEFTPNTFTTGKYVGALCDWSRYWIVDSLAMTIKRLVELEARRNVIVFIARRETDGMPVLEEAFVRVKLG